MKSYLVIVLVVTFSALTVFAQETLPVKVTIVEGHSYQIDQNVSILVWRAGKPPCMDCRPAVGFKLTVGSDSQNAHFVKLAGKGGLTPAIGESRTVLGYKITLDDLNEDAHSATLYIEKTK